MRYTLLIRSGDDVLARFNRLDEEMKRQINGES
jgi:hypothetical protein